MPSTSPSPSPSITPSATTPVADCGDASHHCLDIQHPDQCCANDSYCFINRSSQVRCCPIGSDCVGDSFCSSDSYFCTITSSVSGLPTPVEGCCARKCPQTSHFLCPPDRGGKCCPYGAVCQAAGNCLLRVQASSTSGCATCGATSGVVVVEEQAGDLSTGAKTGIGVGSAFGVLLLGVMGGLCLLRKRRRKRPRTAKEGGNMRGRAELVGSPAPPPGSHDDGLQDHGRAYSPLLGGGGDGLVSPVTMPAEMLSQRATTLSEGQTTYPHWEWARPEAVDDGGVYELDDGLRGDSRHRPQPPPPEGYYYTPDHKDQGLKS